MSQFPCRKSFCRREKAGWAGYHPVHTKVFLSKKFSQKPCISGYHVKITIIFRDNPYAQTDWSFKNRSACDENNPLFSSLQSPLKNAVRLNGMRLLLCFVRINCLRLHISVRRQTHLYKHSSKDVLNWFGIKTNTIIRIGCAAQTNQKTSDSFNLSFCRRLYSGVLCASENAQPSEFSEWIYSCRGPYIPSMYDSQAP